MIFYLGIAICMTRFVYISKAIVSIPNEDLN